MSLRSSPNEMAAPAPRRRDEPRGRLALAAGVARPQVDHGAPAIRLEAVVAEAGPRLHGLDGREDRRARRGDVVGLADMERHGRSLALDEQPRRRPELERDTRGQRLGVRRVALEPGLRRDRDWAAGAAREPAVLEPVVAEVVDAADARALGDVRDRPPRQHRDVEPFRPRRRRSRRAGAAPVGRRARSAPPPGRASRGTACRRSRRSPGAAVARPPAGRARQRRRPATRPRRPALWRDPDARGRAACLTSGAPMSRIALGRRRMPTATRTRSATQSRMASRVDGRRRRRRSGRAVRRAWDAGTALGGGGGDAPAPGSGVRNSSAPRISAPTATPATRPSTMESRGHMGRRVAVRAAGGVPRRPLLPCRSDDRFRGSRAFADPARTPDRARRDAPRGGPPQLHRPGVRGSARRDAELRARPSPPTSR